jgi:lysophospholipase L1-like esterase
LHEDKLLTYLALGDSMSIDDYTGIVGGGAASQFADLIGATEVINLTKDGRATAGVIESLQVGPMKPDVVTLTAGGNDFLQAAFWGADPSNSDGWKSLVELPLTRLGLIAEKLAQFGCPAIMNTIYDPTDGDDSLGKDLGITGSFRLAFHELNDGIRDIARRKGFLLSDLHRLFVGHGINSDQTWIVGQIEPNFAGARAIAYQWYDLWKAKQL